MTGTLKSLHRFSKTSYLLIFSLLLIASLIHTESSYAQSSFRGLKVKKIKNLAKGNFLDENYTQALPMYQYLDSLYPDTEEYLYRLGICYLYSSGEKAKALEYLGKVNNEKQKYAEKIGYEFYYHLGKSHHLNNRFDEAKEHYDRVLEFKNVTDEYILDINKQKMMCDNGKELVKDILDVRIENLGMPVNTRYTEHSPVISADESILIFTSIRPGNTGGLKNVSGNTDPTGEYFEDVYLAYRVGDMWTKPYQIKGDINTQSHEATIGLSPDGQRLFIYIRPME